MTATVDRAVALLGAADGPPALALLFEVTGVSAISGDTPAAEVAARLEGLRRRFTLAEHLATAYLRDAGWSDPEGIVRCALAEPDAAEVEAPSAAAVAGALSARYPALHSWRREVRAGRDGQRPDAAGTWRLDSLWRAATWEQAALEAERDGQADTWAARMRSAREVLAEARRRDRAA